MELPPIMEILDLRELEPGLFESPPIQDGRARVFGGQLASQALAAASFTVQGAPCHSMHGRFLLPGLPGRSIHFEVSTLHDGKRFAARQVLAIQREQPIFCLTASFQGSPGVIESYQGEMPQVPGPDQVEAEFSAAEKQKRAELMASLPPHVQADLQVQWPIETRNITAPRWYSAERLVPLRQAWFRSRTELPEFENLHRCALTYATDFFPVQTCVMPLGVSIVEPALQLASLDHNVWFHRPFRADEWLLYSGTCDTVADGRGLARGQVFSAEGQLVATVVQEGLVHQLDGEA